MIFQINLNIEVATDHPALSSYAGNWEEDIRDWIRDLIYEDPDLYILGIDVEQER